MLFLSIFCLFVTRIRGSASETSTTAVFPVHMLLWSSLVSHTQSPSTYPYCVHGTGTVDSICSLGHSLQWEQPCTTVQDSFHILSICDKD